MEQKEDYKSIVMSLELKDGSKLFFLTRTQCFGNDKHNEEDACSNFYFYNMHTCPTNWLQDVEQVVHVVDGEVSDPDPHGLFRLEAVFSPGDIIPAVSEIPNGKGGLDKVIEEDEMNASVMVRQLLDAKDWVIQLLEARDKNQHDTLIEMWRLIMNDKLALYQLSAEFHARGLWAELEVMEDGTGYWLTLHKDDQIPVIPLDDKELERVKFLIEFDVLMACNN